MTISLRQVTIVVVALSIVPLAASLITSVSGRAQTPPAVNTPRIPRVGDSLTIRRNNDEIIVGSFIGKDGDLNCFSMKSSIGEATQCNTSEGNFVRATGNLRPGSASPHSGSLSFPLFVGKSWNHPYTYTFSNLSGGQIWTRDRRATVTSYEKITVAAGTFDAFKIESSTSWQTSGNIYRPAGVALETYYYSPEIGATVKYDSADFGDTHTELISYTRAK